MRYKIRHRTCSLLPLKSLVIGHSCCLFQDIHRQGFIYMRCKLWSKSIQSIELLSLQYPLDFVPVQRFVFYQGFSQLITYKGIELVGCSVHSDRTETPTDLVQIPDVVLHQTLDTAPPLVDESSDLGFYLVLLGTAQVREIIIAMCHQPDLRTESVVLQTDLGGFNICNPLPIFRSSTHSNHPRRYVSSSLQI